MKKMQCIVVMMVLLIAGMSVTALAKEKAQVTPPQIITLAEISLPQDVKEKYAEQTVAVKVKATISVYGTIDGEVKIVTSSGDAAFDNAVIESIQKSVFSPAYSDTTAIASSIILPLHVKVEKNILEEQVNNEVQPITK